MNDAVIESAPWYIAIARTPNGIWYHAQGKKSPYREHIVEWVRSYYHDNETQLGWFRKAENTAILEVPPLARDDITEDRHDDAIAALIASLNAEAAK